MTSSLFDIAPPTETVIIGGVEHRVRGLPLRIVTELIRGNPKLVTFLSGGGLTAEAIQEQGDQVVATIIAAGYGLPDDEKALKHAADLPLDVQLDLIAGIVKATLGGGTGPFAEKVRRIYEAFGTGKTEDEDRDAKIEIVKKRLSKIQSRKSLNSSLRAETTQSEAYGS